MMHLITVWSFSVLSDPPHLEKPVFWGDLQTLTACGLPDD